MQRITPLVLLSLLLVAAAAPAAGQSGLVANAGPDKTVNSGDTVSFDGTSSTGSVASYNWDFGDGSTATGAAPTHVFSSSGTFTVTLLVIGTAGATSTDTASVIVRTADSTAPNVTTTLPTNPIPGSAINVSATVTDNVAVAGASIYYKTSSDSTFNSTPMTCSGTSANKTCTGQIPSSVTSASMVNYYIRATDTRTPTANVQTYPSNAPTSTLNLTLQDTAAPSITVNAPLSTSSATVGTDLAVNVTITDNAGVSAAQVFYVYAIDGVVPSFGTTNATLTRASGTALNGTWTATIPMDSGNVTANTTDVAFYVRATDGTNNATVPSNAPITYRSIGIVQATAPTVASTPPASATAGSSLAVTATVTANGASVTNVTVWFRSAGTSAYQVLEMDGTGTYNKTIPAANVTDSGVEYYVRANTSSASAFRIFPSAALPFFVGTPPTGTLAPTATRASAGPNVTVNVTWTALASTSTSSVAGYLVTRGPDPGNLTQIANVTSGSRAYYLDESPSIGSLSYYGVTAYDNASTPDGRETTTVLVNPARPPAATATADGIGSVLVTFDTVRAATRYAVEGSIDGGAYSELDNVTSGSSALTGLTPGTTLTVRVRALVGNVSSVNATSASSVLVLGAAATPTGVDASAVSGGVGVSWTNASSAANPATGNFSIYRSASSGGAFVEIANTSALSYTDTTGTLGTAYFYKVAARNAFGVGTLSAAASATPIGPAATPTGLAGSRVSNGVSLSWTNASTAAAPDTHPWSIARSTTSGGTFAEVGTSTATTYVDTTADAGTAYFYKVAGRNALGLGAYTAAASVPVAGGTTGGSTGGSTGGTTTTTPVTTTPVSTTPVSTTPSTTTTTPVTSTTPTPTPVSTTPTTPTKVTVSPTPVSSTPATSTPASSTPASSTPTPTPTPSPTPAKRGFLPGFEVVALGAAVAVAALVLARRRP